MVSVQITVFTFSIKKDAIVNLGSGSEMGNVFVLKIKFIANKTTGV